MIAWIICLQQFKRTQKRLERQAPDHHEEASANRHMVAVAHGGLVAYPKKKHRMISKIFIFHHSVAPKKESHVGYM